MKGSRQARYAFRLAKIQREGNNENHVTTDHQPRPYHTTYYSHVPLNVYPLRAELRSKVYDEDTRKTVYSKNVTFEKHDLLKAFTIKTKMLL
jgi:hypothetical protein